MYILHKYVCLTLCDHYKGGYKRGDGVINNDHQLHIILVIHNIIMYVVVSFNIKCIKNLFFLEL